MSKPVLLGALACLIWASAVIVAHGLAKAFGPITALGYEGLIGGICLAAIYIRQGHWSSMFGHSWVYYLGAGLTWVTHQSFVFLAVGSTNTSSELVIVGLVNYLWPSLTVLLSIPILRKRFTGMLYLGMSLAFGGVVTARLAMYKIDSIDWNFQAYSCAFIAALAWGLYSNLVTRFSNPTAKSAIPLFMLVPCIPLILVGGALGEQGQFVSVDIFLLIIWSILTTAALALWEYGVRAGAIHQLASMSMLIPIVSTFITCVVAGQEITLLLVLAAFAVSSGALICSNSEVKQAQV